MRGKNSKKIAMFGKKIFLFKIRKILTKLTKFTMLTL